MQKWLSDTSLVSICNTDTSSIMLLQSSHIKPFIILNFIEYYAIDLGSFRPLYKHSASDLCIFSLINGPTLILSLVKVSGLQIWLVFCSTSFCLSSLRTIYSLGSSNSNNPVCIHSSVCPAWGSFGYPENCTLHINILIVNL